MLLEQGAQPVSSAMVIAQQVHHSGTYDAGHFFGDPHSQLVSITASECIIARSNAACVSNIATVEGRKYSSL